MENNTKHIKLASEEDIGNMNDLILIARDCRLLIENTIYVIHEDSLSPIIVEDIIVEVLEPETDPMEMNKLNAMIKSIITDTNNEFNEKELIELQKYLHLLLSSKYLKVVISLNKLLAEGNFEATENENKKYIDDTVKKVKEYLKPFSVNQDLLLRLYASYTNSLDAFQKSKAIKQ